MMPEYLYVVFLIFVGYSIVSVVSHNGIEITIFALPVGVCLYIFTTYVLIISDAPTYPYVAISILSMISIYCLWVCKSPKSKTDLISIAAWLFACLIIFYICNRFSLVKYHFDSLRYLIVGALLAGDNLDTLSKNLLEKRLSSISVINSPSLLFGGLYIKALLPTLSVNALLILYWMSYRGIRSVYNRNIAHIIAISSVLLIISINRYVWSAFYINDHLLEALYILVLVGVGWLCAIGALSTILAVTLQTIAIIGVVLSRPEGFIMAGLALMPVLLSDTVPKSNRIVLCWVWAAAIFVQQSALLLGYASMGHPASEESATIILVFSFAIVALSPALRLGLITRHSHRILFFAQSALWLVLAGLAVSDWSILEISLRATFENVVGGAGRWGPSLAVLAVLVTITLCLPDNFKRNMMSFPVISFIPTVFILAYLRDNPYRVGITDSLNRMIIHIVPLSVLLVASAANLSKSLPIGSIPQKHFK